MHNYVSGCLRISMRLYFAILGVGMRSLWCAGFTDPPKPSGWYRISQIYREQNNIGDVSQLENSNVTITDKTDWIILILLSLIGLFVVVICDFKWQREVPLNETFAGLPVKLKLLSRNRKKERKLHSDYRCWHSHIHFTSICLIFATYIISNSSLSWRGK